MYHLVQENSITGLKQLRGLSNTSESLSLKSNQFYLKKQTEMDLIKQPNSNLNTNLARIEVRFSLQITYCCASQETFQLLHDYVLSGSDQ